MDPTENQGVKIFNQPFDMNAFLQHKIQAAAAMTYNELAQVLETKNPKTGKLYTLKDLNVIPMQSQGTAMLEDGLFTTKSWLAANTSLAERFIAASDEGWIYCRDHVQECTNIVLQNGPTLGKGHQLWMMNEINKLIWPNKLGIGVMDPAAFKQTAAISLKYGGIKHPASSAAYTTVEAKAALNDLKNKVKGIDVYGKSYKPITVKIVPGGK
jgi:NitT/TauT family transport system substrate-binding protein